MAEEIRAPLAGNVCKLAVEVGAIVAEDDEVVILEAMKMETPIYAPRGGKILEIRVKEGDAVEEDDVLAIIE